MSPTARSLKWLRDRGWIAGVVEQTLRMPGRPFGNKKDLFGFVDIVAAQPVLRRVAFIQVTSTGNLSARIKKAHDVAPTVLVALSAMLGVDVEFHGWSKKGPRGKAKRWTITRRMPSGTLIQEAKT